MPELTRTFTRPLLNALVGRFLVNGGLDTFDQLIYKKLTLDKPDPGRLVS